MTRRGGGLIRQYPRSGMLLGRVSLNLIQIQLEQPVALVSRRLRRKKHRFQWIVYLIEKQLLELYHFHRMGLVRCLQYLWKSVVFASEDAEVFE